MLSGQAPGICGRLPLGVPVHQVRERGASVFSRTPARREDANTIAATATLMMMMLHLALGLHSERVVFDHVWCLPGSGACMSAQVSFVLAVCVSTG